MCKNKITSKNYNDAIEVARIGYYVVMLSRKEGFFTLNYIYSPSYDYDYDDEEGGQEWI